MLWIEYSLFMFDKISIHKVQLTIDDHVVDKILFVAEQIKRHFVRDRVFEFGFRRAVPFWKGSRKKARVAMEQHKALF